MALPKRRHSRARGRKRRTHWKLAAPNVVECPNCHQARLPHHICPNCGFYNGRKVVAVEEV
ncbi:MAG: 50S ribosomal protein L32 [Candidatus Zixiibacteriota bacterium]|nr:MAG: 50S ribosomal protein L32 [candidate division Zixibacteria bacterium]